ncbi:MAG: hypothetical protein AAB323_00680 [Pseudomonadota bacterium]
MRKSLLVTSALGLMMPTLAMANAAGSSSAACGSGFFAQFDAKIMNAKLEIKNEIKNASNQGGGKQSEGLSEAGLIAAEEEALADKIKIIFGELSEEHRSLLIRRLDLQAFLNAETVEERQIYLYAAVRGKWFNDLKSSVFNNVGLTNEQIKAITEQQIRQALSSAATPLGTVADGNPLTASGNILSEEAFYKTFEDLELVRAAIVKDKDAFKGKENISLKDVMGRMFANKILISSPENGEDWKGIEFKNLADQDIRSFDSIFVVSSYELNAGNFELEKKKFLTDQGKKDQRAQAWKNAAWFKDAMAAKTAAIVSGDATSSTSMKDRSIHHHALAGGVGATVGWWQNLGGFALSISGSGDYLWGTFRVVDDAAGVSVKAEDKRKLGFGFQGDVGVHYVVSPSTTLGILLGLRGQQLNIGRTDKTKPATTTNKDSKGDYASKWMINPVVTLQARTFFTDTVYGALSVGYVIPMSERDYKLENTNIDKDAKVRFQGLTGAFSVGMMF